MPAPKDPIKRQEWIRKNRDAHIGLLVGKKNPMFGKPGTNTGKKFTEEHKKKMGDAQRGEKHHHYGKPAYNKGKPMSEAQKRKISIARQNLSEVSRKNMSEAQKARGSFSETTRKRMSESHKGKILSEEHKKKIGVCQRGEKNHMWKGGVSFEPYCELWTNEFKVRVRTYYNYICVECGTPHSKYVHHVHYNKKMCCDGSPHDVVVLCLRCHNKTNHNREYWEQYFTDMIYGYYGGKSFLTKEEYKAWKHQG